MTPKEKQALQAHLEAAAAILFKHTPREQLQDFESIESSVRDHLLEQVSPLIGNFFVQRHRNEGRTQAAGTQLSGSVERQRQAGEETRLEGESPSQSLA